MVQRADLLLRVKMTIVGEEPEEEIKVAFLERASALAFSLERVGGNDTSHQRMAKESVETKASRASIQMCHCFMFS